MVDIFDKPEQVRGGPAFVAPGLPAAALSGSPVATLSNLAAIGGAQAGGAITSAIQTAISGPAVDPLALADARREAFANEVVELQQQGEFLGDALLKAARSNAASLSPNERLKALVEGQEIREKEINQFRKITDFVKDSDEVKSYLSSVERFDELLTAAKKGGKGNDFVVLQQSLKILDPTSATQQGEIDVARAIASGRINFSGLQISDETIDFFANNGQLSELTDTQKAEWLQGIARAVKAQQQNAATVIQSATDQVIAEQLPIKKFDQSISTIQSRFRDPDVMLASAIPDFAPGNDITDPKLRTERAINNLIRMGKELGGSLLGFGNGKSDRQKLREKDAKIRQLRRMKAYADTNFKEEYLNYKHGAFTGGNPMHNMIMETLRVTGGSEVTELEEFLIQP